MSAATPAAAQRRKKAAPAAHAGNPADVRIDPEFASLIPALAADELAQLEASLLAAGCRDPLVVWKEENILLDGHNRHRLCAQHDLSYKVVRLSFAGREAARDFILHTQLGRRNLTAEAASYLRGKRYLQTRRQGARTDLTSGQNAQKWAAQRLAAEYKVNEKTIRRDGAFALAVDTIAENSGDEARRWILSRDLALARSGVLHLAKLSPDEQRAYVAAALRGAGRPRFPAARTTITLPRQPEELAPRLLDGLGRDGAAAVARLLAQLLGTTAKKKAGGRSRRRSEV